MEIAYTFTSRTHAFRCVRADNKELSSGNTDGFVKFGVVRNYLGSGKHTNYEGGLLITNKRSPTEDQGITPAEPEADARQWHRSRRRWTIPERLVAR